MLSNPLKLFRKKGREAEREILALDACPLCGTEARTLVCTYNRFILFDDRPDEASALYDYSLCHGCGVVYAVNRPIGERFRHLLAHFNETLGRQERQSGSKIALNPFPLTDRDREDIKRLAKPGVLVSEHQGLSRKEWLPAMLQDKIANAVHVELLGSLLSLDRPRVLEIRSRCGSILEALRRLHGAEVFALSIFESQQLIVETFHDIPAVELIDFENFSIPYDGSFDLIICNHMLTHSIHPGRFLECVKQHLKPGGHLYLYNEPDDQDYIGKFKNVYSVLNPFHLQALDGPSLVRAIAAHEFETLFLTHANECLTCLARYEPGHTLSALTDEELQARVDYYRDSRDIGFVKLPAQARAMIDQDWDETCERLKAMGHAFVDEKGKLRSKKGQALRRRD